MKGLLFIVLAATLWAVDSLIRYPLLTSGVSALKIVFYEHLFLGLFVFFQVFKSFRKFWQGQVSHIFYFLLVGGAGSALATLCFTKAMGLINISLVILLQKLQAVVAIFLAHWFLQEPVKRPFIFWGLICLLGAMLVSFHDLSQIDFSDWQGLLGQQAFVGYGLTLIAVIGWGASTVFGKKLALAGYAEKELMAGRFFFALLVLTPWFYMKVGDPVLTYPEFSKILIMALISGMAAMFLYYHGLKMVSARVAALAEMFFPVAALALNWMILDAKITEVQIVGGALLTLGAAVIQFKKY